jgi:hypothetical protein
MRGGLNNLKTWLAQVSLLGMVLALVAMPATAQLAVGDNTKINFDGTLGFGYSGGWGDGLPSSHATAFNGFGNLTGYYYHPNFLSFNVLPYYNRTQNNSLSQAIVNSSGVSSTVSLFTGSYFPGSIFYGRDFSSNGQYGLPGTGSLTQDGSSQSWGATWSALIPDLPTLTASYSARNDTSSILGVSGESHNRQKNFTLDSTYRWSGWDMRAFYAYRKYSANYPDFLGGESFSDLGSNGYGVSAQHKIPLSGNFSASYSRTTYTGTGTGSGNNNVNNYASLSGNISPWRRLSISSDLRYTDNLMTFLPSEVVPSGGATPILYNSMNAKSLILTNFAYLSVGKGFLIIGNLTHSEQWYDGQQFSNTQYGGTLSYRYARPLLGLLYFNFGLVDNATKEGHSSLGFNGNVGLNRKVGRWDTAADFGYSQNVQTLISNYATSSYSYGGNVRRRLNSETHWSAAARAMHSALVQTSGDGNRAETYSTGLFWRRYGVTGSYSQSKGTSVMTSGGLVPTPIGGILTNDILVFDGNSTTISASGTPLRRMTVTAYFSKVNSHTGSILRPVPYVNNGKRYDARLEYRLRKLSLIGEFTRTNQVITSYAPSGAVVNAYTFTVSRWFHVF